MIAVCCHKNHLRFLLSIGLAVFVALFVLVSPSFSQEFTSPESTSPEGIEVPAGSSRPGIYDRAKAIQIVQEENGGPGGCGSIESCDTFCDSQENSKICMDWALANGVISQNNYNKYSGFAVEGGPGGCETQDTCKAYCEDESNFEECLGFGEKQGLISKEQADKSRKTGPRGCRTQKDCQILCENPQNHDICLEHAVLEGFMTKEEAQRIKEFQVKANEFRKKTDEFRKRAQDFEKLEVEKIDPDFDEEKARQILAVQGGPGGCATFDECEDFCDNPDNQLTCFEFAEKNNLFTNKEHAQKIRRISQEGGPGSCRGERACRQFCENEANFEVCLEFAQKHDLLLPGEIEKARRGIEALREGGPAGCKNKDECEKVCQDSANQEVCLEWAKKHGLISEEEAKFIEEAKKMRKEFESKRQQFEGELHPSEGFRPPDGFQPPGEFLGPRGCRGADECRKYCSSPEHQRECEGGFKTPSGSQPPGFEGTSPAQFTPPPHSEPYPTEQYPQYTRPVCPDGQYWNDQECITDPQKTNISPESFYKSDFEIDCVNAGARWTGTTCEKPSIQPSYEDPARVCAEKGGMWMGSECKITSPVEPTSFRNQLFLGAIIRYLLK